MNNDLISREALKKDIEENAIELGSVLAIEVDCVKALIDNAPTVDTTCPNCDSGYAQGYSDGYLKGKEERPQGEWEKVFDHYHDKVIFRCSICGRLVKDCYRDDLAEFYPYCNCGADMRGKDEVKNAE